ncbi:arylsulfotransferase [Penicillium atrosanguineum]|uniref:Arylsulfotransferase n=1 Tax=Penicillium atrosanguineum TaxID=1132637 RepID=A0A9W9PZZ4_9EURO|nr:uncharacterized protein N7443_002879 [Penicillium atrosanguineum]KAJ5140505.1 arylsulfotransferase [Penicillium atrosanguineum]KAJ5310418.1 hypothetical protein N7443_002879 [Penicillium atrosanguineum]KAJ5315938.1 arylsulfotransferase [Penicillium atrosanguineum]
MVGPAIICTCIAALAWAVHGDFVSTEYEPYNNGDLGHRPHLEFHSSSEFAPLLQVNIWNRSAISDTGSHVFLRHDGNSTSPLASPLILDANDLSAVFMNRSFENVFGTRIQENFSKKYLTFWEGYKSNGIGDGYGLVYDDTYRLVYKVWAQNMKVHSDLHEFAFTGNGTALVTGVNDMIARGSDFNETWGLPNKFEILDAAFQEIELETNEVLFHWRAIDHLNPMDSHEPSGAGWDAFHLNSIEKTKAGNYLISIRHLHSILLIDGKTGDVIWTLGGNKNDFVELPPPEGVDPVQPLLTMAWQHHARFVPGTDEMQITFFDNHAKVTSHGECSWDCSRGLHIAIDDTVSPPTVQLLREFRHPADLQAQSQGSIQVLSPAPGDIGNVFIGWGRCPSFTEHTSTGETIMNVQFSPWHSVEIPDALDNYRAYKMDWSATPWWDPVIAPKLSFEDEMVVYVSWNGATEVAGWVVRGAETEKLDESQVLATSRRTGFETKLTIGWPDYQYIWADAMDRNGNVIRSTEVVNLGTREISFASDLYGVNNSMFQPTGDVAWEYVNPVESQRLSKTAWALLGTGLGVLFLAGVTVGVIVWHRGNNYNRLGADDFVLGDDFDLDSVVSEGSNDDGEDVDRAANVDPQSRTAEDSRALLQNAEK